MRLSLLTKTENAHDDAVWACTWIPQKNELLTGSLDETVKWFRYAEEGQQLLHTYTSHTLGVISVAISSDGNWAASTSLDSQIRVWDLRTNEWNIIESAPSETWALAFNPKATDLTLAVAGGSKNRVTLWKAMPPEGKEPHEPQEPIAQYALPVKEDGFKKEKFVLSVAYSPDGKRLACGNMDGTVAVFDAESGNFLHLLEGHYKPIRSVTFTPDSRHLLTACDDMHAHMYDVEQASLVEAFSGHESWVLSVAVNPDGTAFATGSSDSKVKLWDLQTRTCAQTVTEHSDQVWGVSFNTDGSRLASVADDKSIAVYEFAH